MRHAAALIAALATAACGSVAGNDDDADATDETDNQHDTQHETENGGDADADADADAAADAPEVPDQAEVNPDDAGAGDDTPGTIDCSVDKLCERCPGSWEIAIDPAPGFPLTIDGEGENSRIVVSGGCEYTAGPGVWFHNCDPTGPVVVHVDSGFSGTYRVHVDATCEEG
ncbi:MAG: hypothetical protein PHU54_07105 [Candidatus Omnitrophica bacterium]|nr:hypothetical protein [Candidatus Omnitrophota bacterium]